MRKVWVGLIPEIFGYGLLVVEDSEEECRKALEEAYNESAKGSYDDYEDQEHEDGTPYTRFEKAFEHWGGGFKHIEFGKVYFDDFGE